jgi:putative transposase
LVVSERRACRTVEQPRSTQRYRVRRPEDEGRLVERMLALVRAHPRYGYRRIWALLRREGWRVNRKRVHRLWRREGLRVPQKARKRRRLGSGANGCGRLRPGHKDHVCGHCSTITGDHVIPPWRSGAFEWCEGGPQRGRRGACPRRSAG